ncbi:MAG: SulP family inorganic anion transporter [Novosphingobium sp. 28-62-57]|uniref:SulP family inorganic anion transporter n=1 Tax=unclassified Novosphingobium TaxID=2644732 RepID=UPI000BD3D1EB|nr:MULTISPECIES: SulP family inorganic anion transporter [unclassified Novosphingobium]OYW48601.1 MAG: SulP family inorganic anion transporter [Novosphingobium sp. 12-62-10]OYZ10154.1 MAG: SulP family inorganic anion transporter [Novosphingobium sp. 28-62-57]OZA38100.1 MAG: SulP family inorganic anion transporter [Novosphingobium sp. 17-62-9]HQS69040.1 SulP family inorganic anion transporter [Novosphingobium sp.]
MTSAAATTIAPGEPSGFSRYFVRDFTASIVVFLVAMPLCMGIAIASGVPPEKGLVTGIIGGIVVGLLAGSPLQVSGPAAGLAVIVFEFVRDNGLSALGPVLVLAGALQVIAGIARMGGVFRAISPAVVHGMLAGIGALIVIGQFHILFDAKPLSSGIDNMAMMPTRLLSLTPFDIGTTELALMLGLLTIGTMIVWEKVKPASLGLLPGALLGVLAATGVAWAFGLNVARIAVPDSIAAAFALPEAGIFSTLTQGSMIVSAIAIAFIASAETLLSAAAVDRMHDGVRTDYNKELRAQGVGNLLCGVFNALPMTGVIVRSSANVQAGAMTRTSAVLHGAWILGFVALLPFVLRQVPMAALGGVLVVTGWKLISLKHVQHLYKVYGYMPALIWTATFVLVVTTDLLTGVLVGLALSALELLPFARNLKFRVGESSVGDTVKLELEGAATFIGLARLTNALEQLPQGKAVHVDLDRVHAIDHTTSEMLTEWLSRRRMRGNAVKVTGPAAILKSLAHAA